MKSIISKNIILTIIKNPITFIEKEISKFEDVKFSFIFMLIITGVMTLINLLKTIFNTVYVRSSFWFEEVKSKWVWSNLKHFQWGEVIFKNFFLFALIILAITLIYFLASLIIKEEVKFQKLLGIASISMISIIVFNMVIAPLFSIVYVPLGLIFMVIGSISTILLIILGMSTMLNIENKDLKFYVNLVCLSLIGIISYYLFFKNIIYSPVFKNILDLLS